MPTMPPTPTCCQRRMREIVIQTPSGELILHACGRCERQAWHHAGASVTRTEALGLAASVPPTWRTQRKA